MIEEPSATPRSRVLVVEDDSGVRDLLVSVLEQHGYGVQTAISGDQALERLARELFDLVLLDLNLPGTPGLEVLAIARPWQTDAQFVVLTGQDSIGTAVEAMRRGAYDYVSKPFHIPELLLVLDRGLAETDLRREVARLRRRTGDPARATIVGNAPAMRRMFELLERVAPTRATVLVTGETGTGKELVARAVHEMSGRGRKAFVAVNCSALPETLLESELFGHEKGAFTGAIATRRGLFEEAAGGTLFLDEIATVSHSTQVKLLRVLEQRQVQRIGSSQPLSVDFRLVAAANVDLADEAAAGRFREDLYFRLNVFPVYVPPLRERREDIPLLAEHFRAEFADEHGVEPPAISPETMRRLTAYDWPGNVRELRNYIERACILHAGARQMPFEPLAPPTSGRAAPAGVNPVEAICAEGWSLERLEREYILRTIERAGGNVSRSAEILGVDRRTLQRKTQEYRSLASATGQRGSEARS